MTIVPVTLSDAKAFVAQHHRHNGAPVSWKFGVALNRDGTEDEPLIGVAMAGRPIGRELDKWRIIEITRVCTVKCLHANSKLYGAICRMARAAGYTRAYSYTLQSESGASLKAAGFVINAVLDARETWDCPARTRIQTDLLGQATRPAEPKIRWKREL